MPFTAQLWNLTDEITAPVYSPFSSEEVKCLVHGLVI